jgi:hypothetical protein
MPGCDGSRNPAGVVLLQGEDHLATVRANLVAAGADLSRIVAYDKSRFLNCRLLLPDDLPVIEHGVAAVRAQLVVIDPWPAFSCVQLTSDRATREALAPLVALADRTGVAVVVVRHRTKNESANPIYRGAGSIAMIALARSALLVDSDPGSDDPHCHVLVQIKANLSTAVPLAYRTVKSNEGIAIEWLGPSKLTAQDLAHGGQAPRSRLWEAACVLYGILSDGPVWSQDAIRAAAAAGIAKHTLDRSKRVLGVVCRKCGSGRGSKWVWKLPDDEVLLRPFKDKEIGDLTDMLISSDDDPPVPRDAWDRGHRGKPIAQQDKEDEPPLAGDEWKRGDGGQTSEWPDDEDDEDDEDDAEGGQPVPQA